MNLRVIRFELFTLKAHLHVLIMFSVQEAKIVHIPRKTLFYTIVSTMDLTIHETGYDISPTGLFTAWLKVDLPRRLGDRNTYNRLFFGDDSLTQIDAEESVAHAALSYFCKYHNIAIDDYSYGSLSTVTSELLASQEHVHVKEKELDEAIRGTSEAHKDYRNDMESLADICIRFSDVLPFRRSSHRQSTVAGVLYNGPKRPRTRIEQLAFDMYCFFTGTNPVGGRTTWL
jgi:hypothetical protein